jgi:hypothetical protein
MIQTSFEAGQRLWLKSGQVVEFIGPAGEDRCVVAKVIEFDGDDDEGPSDELGDEIVLSLDKLHAKAPREKIDAEIVTAQGILADLRRQIEQQANALRISPDKKKALESIYQFEILHAWVTGLPIWIVTVDHGARVQIHQRQMGEKRYVLQQSYAKRGYDMRGGECAWEVGIDDERYSSIYSRHVFLSDDEATVYAKDFIAKYISSKRDELKHYPDKAKEIAGSMRRIGLDVPTWIDEIVAENDRNWHRNQVSQAEAKLQQARAEEQKFLTALPVVAKS